MLTFMFHRKIFKVCQMCFSTFCDSKTVKCDVINMHSIDSEDLSYGNVYSKLQYTLENDLATSEEMLLQKVKKNCRYEIRRCEREGVTWNVYCNESIHSDLIHSFQITYNKMFADKNVSGYQFNYNLIVEGKKSGNVIITACSPDDNKNLTVYHAYLCDGKRTMLLYSASPLWGENKNTANIIGRVNKYSHWKDILWFVNQKYKFYEWGGIHSIDNPNGIDRFKMEFGGRIVSYYNYTIPKSIKGILYVLLVKKLDSIHKKNLDNKTES